MCRTGRRAPRGRNKGMLRAGTACAEAINFRDNGAVLEYFKI